MSALKVQNLKLGFRVKRGFLQAVDDVSFELERGGALGLVGESGSGKSATALAILGLLPMPPAEIVDGRILLDERDLLKMSQSELRPLRGGRISMVFQEPMTALNPVLRIGEQVAEAIYYHQQVGWKEARKKAVQSLADVGLPDPDERARQYPHEMSGGMRQRVMIAQALACRPDFLLCDEPTTALDVTIQAGILQLLAELQERLNMGILLISHDLGVVAQFCEQVAVMYAGQIVEQSDVRSVLQKPRHPYTQALLHAHPGAQERGAKLVPIEGTVPDLTEPQQQCRFVSRCSQKIDGCSERVPEFHDGLRCFLQDGASDG